MAPACVCEHVDLRDGRLLVAIHLRGLDLPEGTRVAVRLRTRSGRVAASADGEVVPRVSTVGVWTRAALRVELELPADDGAFRLEVEDVTQGGRGFVPVGPTPGLLASSRRLEHAGRWFQALPAAGSPAVWFRRARPGTGCAASRSSRVHGASRGCASCGS